MPSKRAITQELGVAGSTVDKAMTILKEGPDTPSEGTGALRRPQDERPKPKRDR